MASIAILATVILLIVGIFLSGFKRSQKGRDHSSGVLVAKAVLAEELLKIQKGTGAVSSATFFSQDFPDLSGAKTVGQTSFSYLITHQLLVQPDGTVIGDLLPGNRLKLVKIVVKWTRNGTGSPEQGLQEVSISKLINQRAFVD